MPFKLLTLLVAHLQFAQADTQTRNCKRATKPTHQDSRRMNGRNTTEKEQRTANSTLPKVAVQCFVRQFCGYINFSASYESLC